MARRARRRDPDPGDVLAGRVSCDVHQLVALIHAVNPTERGLSAREAARAYATKSALQSLLVRRFFEHVRITESAAGIVALSLRATGALAAHCPIDALDEDARSRVRFALDAGTEAASTEPGSSPPATRSSARGYAELAQEALDRYDYEKAQAILREACREAPADPAPAIALLELLVDQLGDLSAAFEHWASLDPGMRAESRIAGVMATAAALQGDVERARELLGTRWNERAAEAWAHLGRRAMADGDAALAGEARDALALGAPAHPTIREVDRWLAARATEARRDAEARLLEAQAAELAPDQLTAMAKALEQRHPGSAVAARVLRALQTAAVQAQIEALLASADELAPHDDAAAAATWREALSLGADPSAFAARLKAAEERLQRARVARVIDEIAATFAHDREAALVRALEDERPVREGLRAHLEPDDAELLGRAERMLGARPKAAARAALAFAKVRALFERGHHADAARLLDRHDKLLGALPETPALRQRLHDARQRERESAAKLALRAAREALDRADLDDAKRIAGRIRAAELPPDQAASHARLLAAIEDAEHLRIFEATLELRESQGHWLEVAKACEAALERAEPERAAALAERAARARAELRNAYRVTDLPLRSAEECGLPPYGRGSPVASPITTSSARGRVVLVSGGAGWLIVRWMVPARDAVERVVCLRSRAVSSTAKPDDLLVEEDRVVIATSDGFIYTLDPEGEALVEIVRLDTDPENPNRIALVSDGRYAWQLGGEIAPLALIFDTRTGQLRRQLSGFDRLSSVPDAPLVLRPFSESGSHFFDAFAPRGSRIAERVPAAGRIVAVGKAEDGDDLEVLCTRGSRAGRTSYVLSRTDVATATTKLLLELETPSETTCSWVATSEALYVCVEHADRAVLEVYTLGARAERKWRNELAHAALVPSSDGEPPYALVPRPRGQRHTPLSLEPLTVDGSVPIVRRDEAPGARRLPLTESARRQSEGGVRPELLSMMPDIVLQSFKHDRDEEEASIGIARLIEAGREKHVDALLPALEIVASLGPTLRVWRVKRTLDAGRFREATAMLDELEPLVEQAELRSWCRWARGIAAYASGELERAIEVWATEEEDAHAAESRRLIERVESLHQGTVDPGDADAALLRAIRESDERARAGDLDGAIAALDHHLVWLLHEPQSFGRLAARHLEREPRAAGPWLRKLEVLIEHCTSNEPCSVVLAVPGAHWSEERLRAVRADARRWLDEATPPRA